MPSACMVLNCRSNRLRDQLSFYRIPSVFDNNKHFNKLASERREAWITSLHRSDITDSKLKYGRICSKHFVSGKPSKLQDRNDPDWVPSVDMGYTATVSNSILRNYLNDKFKRGQGPCEQEGIADTNTSCSRHQLNFKDNCLDVTIYDYNESDHPVVKYELLEFVKADTAEI
ncbi:hypothetical protein NQ315_017015 [Exocentrus adspersus]|uniref:THAP-type domain-containing protein n=1 Tax=Exocentrus adspersus TaxID=1586481 RepID=A0AAV8VAV3_9CUCU|nr:hypothetical protein NQ315_017015 [Exocentrus adspersus]